MFLPPAGDNETWPNNHLALARYTSSFAAIDSYYASMAAAGFTVLSYYNVAEFGQQMLRRGSNPPEDWRDAQTYLRNHLAAAIPLDANRKPVEHAGWDGDISLDANVPVYQEYLVAQAQRHLDKLPHFMVNNQKRKKKK